jgi:hypothetical protein
VLGRCCRLCPLRPLQEAKDSPMNADKDAGPMPSNLCEESMPRKSEINHDHGHVPLGRNKEEVKKKSIRREMNSRFCAVVICLQGAAEWRDTGHLTLDAAKD